MAAGTISRIGSLMDEDGPGPGRSIVARRTLAGKMIGRFVLGVAADTICGAHGLVVEDRPAPGRSGMAQ